MAILLFSFDGVLVVFRLLLYIRPESVLCSFPRTNQAYHEKSLRHTPACGNMDLRRDSSWGLWRISFDFLSSFSLFLVFPLFSWSGFHTQKFSPTRLQPVTTMGFSLKWFQVNSLEYPRNWCKRSVVNFTLRSQPSQRKQPLSLSLTNWLLLQIHLLTIIK